MISWVVYLSFGLVIGIVVGLFASRMGLFSSRRQLELEQELEASREELAGYRKDVAEHFVQTSALVNTMTESYRAVFDHLSQGAKDLCGDEVNAYRLDLPEKKLIEEADTAADEEISAADVVENVGAAEAQLAEDDTDKTNQDISVTEEVLETSPETPQETAQETTQETKRMESGAEPEAAADSNPPEESGLPHQPDANEVSPVSAGDTSDDEHAAYAGEQAGPPGSGELQEEPGEDRTVH